MSDAPEVAILRKLMIAADAILAGGDDALALLGPLPASVPAFLTLDATQRTAARALLKVVEQAQDVLARIFCTYLLAEQVDISTMTARDIANRMEQYGLLAGADQWSGLVRLRNRLAHEYPVSPTEQLERVTDAAAAVPTLRAIRDGLVIPLRAKGYAP